MSNIAKIKLYDVGNGDGIRTSVFFSGCNFHCEDCHNKDIWDFQIGEKYSYELYLQRIKPHIKTYVQGLSILGGEPLCKENIKGVCELIKQFKHEYPNKNIWLWTGCTWEKIYSVFASVDDDLYKSYLTSILLNIDVLIDGLYEKDKHDLKLKYRGSSNQRIIDVKKTIQNKGVVLYEK